MSTRTRFAIATGAAGALGALAVAATRTGRNVGTQIGGIPDGDRLTRMQRSRQWRDGRFRNRDRRAGDTPAADSIGARDVARRFLIERPQRGPNAPVPLASEGVELPTEGLHFSWLGHASVLVSLGGERLLFDPVWSERCSPSPHVGPRRLHAIPCDLSDLPPLRAVVISHDHYDHRDMETIRSIHELQPVCEFVVPLGVGAHLERWGVEPRNTIELDWDECHRVGSIELTAVACQHFSGRGLHRNNTLWSSWAARSPAGSVYFSGDTGYFSGFEELRDAYGPFDVAFMAIGMYDPAWRAMHLNPEEAVQAGLELGAGLLAPIHWCTFALAPHAWSDPPERFVTAAEEAGVAYVIPLVGQPVAVAEPPRTKPWWRP